MEHEPDKSATGASLASDLCLLVQESRDYAEAEIAYQKSRACLAGRRIRNLALLALMALGFLFLSLLTLPVGLVLALTPEVGIWAAIGLAILAFALVGCLCAAMAAIYWKRTMRVLGASGRRDD